MHNVLPVYKQLSIQFDENGMMVALKDDAMVHTLSYDEKLGIQAVATTSAAPFLTWSMVLSAVIISISALVLSKETGKYLTSVPG